MRVHNTWMVFAGFMIVACSNPKDANKDNFGKAISKYIANQGEKCVAKSEFPHKHFSLGDNEWEALAKAGLVDATESGKSSTMVSLSYTVYDLTEEGRALYTPEKGFCYGVAELVDVGNFTEPSNLGPYTVSEVSYTYQITGIPDWAKNEAVQQAFKTIKAAVESSAIPIKGSKILALTNEGWVDERQLKK